MSEISTLRLLEEMNEALDLERPPVDRYDRAKLVGKLSVWEESGDTFKLSIDEKNLILEIHEGNTSELKEIWVAPRIDPLLVKNIKNKRTLVEEFGFEKFSVDEQTSLRVATVLECEATEGRPYPRAWLDDGTVMYITEDIKGRCKPLERVQVLCKDEEGTCEIKRGIF